MNVERLKLRLQELERMLGRKNMETEILKEALEVAHTEKLLLRLPPEPKFCSSVSRERQERVYEQIVIDRPNNVEILRRSCCPEEATSVETFLPDVRLEHSYAEASFLLGLRLRRSKVEEERLRGLEFLQEAFDSVTASPKLIYGERYVIELKSSGLNTRAEQIEAEMRDIRIWNRSMTAAL